MKTQITIASYMLSVCGFFCGIGAVALTGAPLGGLFAGVSVVCLVGAFAFAMLARTA